MSFLFNVSIKRMLTREPEKSLSTVLYDVSLVILNNGSSYTILMLLGFIISFVSIMNAFSLASSNDDLQNPLNSMTEIDQPFI